MRFLRNSGKKINFKAWLIGSCSVITVIYSYGGANFVSLMAMVKEIAMYIHNMSLAKLICVT